MQAAVEILAQGFVVHWGHSQYLDCELFAYVSSFLSILLLCLLYSLLEVTNFGQSI